MYFQQYSFERALSLGLIKFGAGSYGRPVVHYWDLNTTVTIGRYCSIAKGVEFLLGGEHGAHYTSTFPFTEFLHRTNLKIKDSILSSSLSEESVTEHPLTKGDIIVGNDVWIGQNALILSGVNIGNGAIVGAGAVVASDVPDYAIVVGNPAKVIRFRFNEKEIERLNEIQWWNWPESEIWEHNRVLMSEPKALFTLIGSSKSNELKNENS
jgi:acetyltransferase-like isoleucine patch superfamily enzyme